MDRLAPSVTVLSPQLRTTDGWTSFIRSSRCDRVVFTVSCRRRQEHLARGGAHVIANNAQECDRLSPRQFHDQDAQATNALSQVTSTRKGGKVFEVQMQVDDDDIDLYGVVNNAIYASYINSVHDVLLEYLGIGVQYWAATGNAMATSELNLKYLAPLRSGDRFIVKVWPEKIKGVRLVMRHMIETVPDGKLVLDSRATIVFLNKDYRPTRVFPQVAAKMWEVFGCKEG